MPENPEEGQGRNTSDQAEFDWKPFFERVRNAGASETLKAALKVAAAETPSPATPLRAVDLGCGEGRDTIELLKHGWHVVAVDSCHAALEALKDSAAKQNLAAELEVIETSFEDAVFDRADLVSANLSLPYCSPGAFPQAWKNIVRGLNPGAYLACNLFGDRHTWAVLPLVTSFTRDQIDELVKELEVVELKEIEREAFGADGSKIVDHEYLVLAKKKATS